jgi:hypothetical protein
MGTWSQPAFVRGCGLAAIRNAAADSTFLDQRLLSASYS